MHQFTKGDLEKLAVIIREVTGNQVQEKNYSMIESRLRGRLLKLALSSVDKYWEHYKKNEKEEREVLQSLMTTHYTFFFREYSHFEALGEWLDSEASRLKARFLATQKPVKIWSAACSRGQEVYSLAMFLEVNLKEKHGVAYEVIGSDIDSESVAYGKNGVYPIKEVNTIPQSYLGKYWKRGSGAVKEFAAIHPAIKARTTFEVANLLDLKSFRPNDTYDVIFCRNVFIYFSDENVKQIALSLASKLDSQGLFVSGVSEPLRFQGWNFVSTSPSVYKPMATHVTKGAAASSATGKPSEVAIKLVETKYSVLCVDDSPTIQLLMKKIFLQDANCIKIEMATNGREAREKLDKDKFDLITLDIHMPEVTGIEFLERLYDKKNDPPVLMVSSVNRTDVDLATKSMSLGAYDYVEKPAMNNLQKSADELLTKARMALRSRQNSQSETTVSSFDNSISQKIVVPDASLCLRLVVCGPNKIKSLEQVIAGQKSEYRSPPLLVIWSGAEDGLVEKEIMKWTDRTVVAVRDAKIMLRPNTINISKATSAVEFISGVRSKNVSLQILDQTDLDYSSLRKNSIVQVLIDETLGLSKSDFERNCKLPVSDITPSTSFPSLSVEFFANLRKAAA